MDEEVCGLMKKDCQYVEPRPGDIRHSLADISQAKKFGYVPAYELKEGLRETIEEWFKNEYK